MREGCWLVCWLVCWSRVSSSSLKMRRGWYWWLEGGLAGQFTRGLEQGRQPHSSVLQQVLSAGHLDTRVSPPASHLTKLPQSSVWPKVCAEKAEASEQEDIAGHEDFLKTTFW